MSCTFFSSSLLIFRTVWQEISSFFPSSKPSTPPWKDFSVQSNSQAFLAHSWSVCFSSKKPDYWKDTSAWVLNSSPVSSAFSFESFRHRIRPTFGDFSPSNCLTAFETIFLCTHISNWFYRHSASSFRFESVFRDRNCCFLFLAIWSPSCLFCQASRIYPYLHRVRGDLTFWRGTLCSRQGRWQTASRYVSSW